MLLSMTGFGTAQKDTNQAIIVIEIKSLNSKFMDLSVKLPRAFQMVHELALRKIINQKLVRGKIFYSLEIQWKNQVAETKINAQLLIQYYNTLKQNALLLGANQDDLFRLALQMPEVCSQQGRDEGVLYQDVWSNIEETTITAIEKCVEFRIQEGNALEIALTKYIQNIIDLKHKIEKLNPRRAENIKERISKQIQELKIQDHVDHNRFEMEMIYYLEKLDIEEELTRLENHLKYFLENIKLPDSQGKKLNFISQEIGREINTMGAKANDTEIQHLVVQMKESLEKIKEQMLNII